MKDPVRVARGRLASVSRKSRGNPAAIPHARRALTVALLERAIREALAADPPPTADQRHELAALLMGGGGHA